MFHDVSDPTTPSTLQWVMRLDLLEALLRFLQKSQFQTISCTDLIAKKDTYLPKTIALTFDDGYASFHTLALPLLKKYGFTATVFMTTDFIDGMVQSGGVDHPALTRAQLQDLAANGIEIGSHGCRHTDMRKLTTEEKDAEFSKSKAILEDITQKKVNVLSYPHGRYDTSTEYAVKKSGYTGACSVFTGLSKSSFTQFAYDRLELSNYAHPLQELEFRLKTSGVYIF